MSPFEPCRLKHHDIYGKHICFDKRPQILGTLPTTSKFRCHHFFGHIDDQGSSGNRCLGPRFCLRELRGTWTAAFVFFNLVRSISEGATSAAHVTQNCCASEATVVSSDEKSLQRPPKWRRVEHKWCRTCCAGHWERAPRSFEGEVQKVSATEMRQEFKWTDSGRIWWWISHYDLEPSVAESAGVWKQNKTIHGGGPGRKLLACFFQLHRGTNPGTALTGLSASPMDCMSSSMCTAPQMPMKGASTRT